MVSFFLAFLRKNLVFWSNLGIFLLSISHFQVWPLYTTDSDFTHGCTDGYLRISCCRHGKYTGTQQVCFFFCFCFSDVEWSFHPIYTFFWPAASYIINCEKYRIGKYVCIWGFILLVENPFICWSTPCSTVPKEASLDSSARSRAWMQTWTGDYIDATYTCYLKVGLERRILHEKRTKRRFLPMKLL